MESAYAQEYSFVRGGIRFYRLDDKKKPSLVSKPAATRQWEGGTDPLGSSYPQRLFSQAAVARWCLVNADDIGVLHQSRVGGSYSACPSKTEVPDPPNSA